MNQRDFVTLGMFIIDQFEYVDESGNATGRIPNKQIGGGGAYAAIGARIWLPPSQIGMVVDRGHDFPSSFQSKLDTYGREMWLFRDQEVETTKALNLYRGQHRGFQYLTPRIRITPNDLMNTPLERPKFIHFICSPTRASDIIAEIDSIKGWDPISIYEPTPDRCIPSELPALVSIIARIHILSPNAEEALSLLSLPQPPVKEVIELACDKLLDLGAGENSQGAVIIRSGELGAYVKQRGQIGKWVDAFWTKEDHDKVIDVTGAGNTFLGGLAAGLSFGNDVYDATLLGTVSSSFTIEQLGLPSLDISTQLRWNGDDPWRRLSVLKARIAT